MFDHQGIIPMTFVSLHALHSRISSSTVNSFRQASAMSKVCESKYPRGVKPYKPPKMDWPPKIHHLAMDNVNPRMRLNHGLGKLGGYYSNSHIIRILQWYPPNSTAQGFIHPGLTLPSKLTNRPCQTGWKMNHFHLAFFQEPRSRDTPTSMILPVRILH